tara:strand:+ start:807 stop:995 length:189 start_codon:yes stop_codon:yes gene_type:complete
MGEKDSAQSLASDFLSRIQTRLITGKAILNVRNNHVYTAKKTFTQGLKTIPVVVPNVESSTL